MVLATQWKAHDGSATQWMACDGSATQWKARDGSATQWMARDGVLQHSGWLAIVLQTNHKSIVKKHNQIHSEQNITKYTVNNTML